MKFGSQFFENVSVMYFLIFRFFGEQQSLEIILDCLLIFIFNDAKRSLASKPFGSLKGVPGGSPALYSGSSVPQGRG